MFLEADKYVRKRNFSQIMLRKPYEILSDFFLLLENYIASFNRAIKKSLSNKVYRGSLWEALAKKASRSSNINIVEKLVLQLSFGSRGQEMF